jgi:cholestenol Delta-isomerase
VSTGRKCDGYRHPKSISPEPSNTRRQTSPKGHQGNPYSSQPSRALVPPTFDDDQQRQVYSFFVTTTSIVSCLYYRRDFWSYRILQLSLAEPAIKYALCSLSALHNMFRASNGQATPSGRTAAEHRAYSLVQCNLAVKHTQKLLSRSKDGDADVVIKGLVACVLPICFENMMGNHKAAQMHLQNGLRIASRYNARDSNQRPNNTIVVPEDIVQVLHRLDLQAMSFCDSREPYPHHYDSSPLKIDTTPPPPFTNLNSAASFLIDTFRTIFRLASLSEPDPVPQTSLDALNTVLTNWFTSFTHLLATSDLAQQFPNSVILMRMYHKFLTILVSVKVYGLESRHDEHLQHYRTLVTLGTTLLASEESCDPSMSDAEIFSFEPGVIFALFFTAINCRHPVVRRQAVELLGRSRHREGAWESVGAAKVASFVIEVEEEGLTDMQKGSAGPEVVKEERRVHLVNVCPSAEERRIDVGCLVRTKSGWDMKSRTVIY